MDIITVQAHLLAVVAILYSTIVHFFRWSSLEANPSVEASAVLFVFIVGAWAVHRVERCLSSWSRLALHILVSALSIGFTYKTWDMYIQGPIAPPVDLTGKVYIVTGANAGVGFETAKSIAEWGGTVVMACRSIHKAKAAQDAIVQHTTSPPERVVVLGLDLCSLDSVRNFVREFQESGLNRLDALILNAGVMQPERVMTTDGMETTMQANHFGHFLLTNLLMPVLESTAGEVGESRVVVVSSSLHKAPSAIEPLLEEPHSEYDFSMFNTYAKSKLANVLFMHELHRQLQAKNSKVTVNALHPGNVRTEVTRNMAFYMRWGEPIVHFFRKSLTAGASTSLFVATHPNMTHQGGGYYVHCAQAPMGKLGREGTGAHQLWELSSKLTGSS